MNLRKSIAPIPPRQTVSIPLHLLAILDFGVYAYSKSSARQWVGYRRWALAASIVAAVKSVAVVPWTRRLWERGRAFARSGILFRSDLANNISLMSRRSNGISRT